jgi:hypothetical protein
MSFIFLVYIAREENWTRVQTHASRSEWFRAIAPLGPSCNSHAKRRIERRLCLATVTDEGTPTGPDTLAGEMSQGGLMPIEPTDQILPARRQERVDLQRSQQPGLKLMRDPADRPVEFAILLRIRGNDLNI